MYRTAAQHEKGPEPESPDAAPALSWPSGADVAGGILEGILDFLKAVDG
jgi:hypothetical protein